MPGILMDFAKSKSAKNKTATFLSSNNATAKKTAAQSVTVTEPYSLKINIESPPLVSYGPPEDSSGALLSGILELRPCASSNAETFDIAKLEMKFIKSVRTEEPIQPGCPACTTQETVLHTWVFIPHPMTLSYDNGLPHGFPFSFLIPGNMPATTRSSLATIEFRLVAEAYPPSSTPITPYSLPHPVADGVRPPSPRRTDSNKPVILTHSLYIQRSILPNPDPRHSHRIFPPTNVSASITLPSIFYPGSQDNEIDIVMQGMLITPKLHWTLKKLSWRIDELAKVVSYACPLHYKKLGCQDAKGILFEDTRVVGAGNMKSGWKRDPDQGKVEALLQIGTSPGAMTACNVDGISDMHVSHNLVIECVVIEEMLHTAMGPKKSGGQWQPTGNARVLRMTFPIMVTARAGMGISWDEEIPPRYEDVAWNVPPAFSQIESSTGRSGSAGGRDRRDSMEGIEAVEGIRGPTSSSPSPGQNFVRPMSGIATRFGRERSWTGSGSARSG